MSEIVYDRICTMLPTYGRHDSYLPMFIESAIKTASSPRNVCFAFCVNENDRGTKDYLKSCDFRGHEYEMIMENLPSPHLAMYFNLLYLNTRTRTQPGTMVSMFGDDMVFETPGWDKTILEWANRYNGIGVFFCNDAFEARDRCCINLMVSKKMVELTGRPFMCPEFEAEMIDVVWHRVGKITKTQHFFPDIIIRHNHNRRKPRLGWDATYTRLQAIQKRVHDRGGKRRAIQIGLEIGAFLLAKNIPGIPGDSDC